MKPKKKVAIFTDPCGWTGETQEQEHQRLREKYTEILPQFDLTFYVVQSPTFEEGTDLVLFDYGGAGGFGNSMMYTNSRRIIDWARDHPSALVIIVSQMTYRAARGEILDMLEEAGEDVPDDDRINLSEENRTRMHNVVGEFQLLFEYKDNESRKRSDTEHIPSWWLE